MLLADICHRYGIYTNGFYHFKGKVLKGALKAMKENPRRKNSDPEKEVLKNMI